MLLTLNWWNSHIRIQQSSFLCTYTLEYHFTFPEVLFIISIVLGYNNKQKSHEKHVRLDQEAAGVFVHLSVWLKLQVCVRLQEGGALQSADTVETCTLTGRVSVGAGGAVSARLGLAVSEQYNNVQLCTKIEDGVIMGEGWHHGRDCGSSFSSNLA